MQTTNVPFINVWQFPVPNDSLKHKLRRSVEEQMSIIGEKRRAAIQRKFAKLSPFFKTGLDKDNEINSASVPYHQNKVDFSRCLPSNYR